jgi:hypothetical protein
MTANYNRASQKPSVAIYVATDADDSRTYGIFPNHNSEMIIVLTRFTIVALMNEAILISALSSSSAQFTACFTENDA